MGAPIPFPKFRKFFEARGIQVVRGRKHFKLIGVSDGEKRVYPFPVRDNEVAGVYMKGAKKAFGIAE